MRRPLVSSYHRTVACRRCNGTNSVPCPQCSGSGRLARGGYQKRNPVNAARVVGEPNHSFCSSLQCCSTGSGDWLIELPLKNPSPSGLCPLSSPAC